ncbi:hypothetical protein, partial [Streptomyces chrestomyceticus]|uniref:hypothetical protein n=1 Tax=Streptomyces chrestomyceticus TaxID=68185 RepID=UPI0033EB59D5
GRAAAPRNVRGAAARSGGVPRPDMRGNSGVPENIAHSHYLFKSSSYLPTKTFQHQHRPRRPYLVRVKYAPVDADVLHQGAPSVESFLP